MNEVEGEQDVAFRKVTILLVGPNFKIKVSFNS